MTERIEALERLQRLRETGALTEEEFAAEKAALLSRAESVPDAAQAEPVRSTTTLVSTRRRPDWLVPAAVGAFLLVLVVAAMLFLRGGPGEDVDTAAINMTAPLPEPVIENQAAPAPPPDIRARPAREQLTAAFAAAFGDRATRVVEEADITFRPGSLIWVGERAVLVSNGTNAEECHACAGMVAVHFLAPQGEGFRVAGEWLSVATDDYGHPPGWRITSELTGRPALRVEGGGGNQGIFCNFVSYYDLAGDGPAEIARVQTGYTDEGSGEEGAGTELEGRIVNVRAGRSFDVSYSGGQRFAETYRLRDGRFAIEGGPSRVPTC